METEGRDVHVVAVTHGGFLHYFTEDFEGAINDGTVGTGWQNTEFRTYVFKESGGSEVNGVKGLGGEGDGDRAEITETRESRMRRKRGSLILTREEQMRLKALAEREWSKDGYQNSDDSEGEGEGEEEEVAKL